MLEKMLPSLKSGDEPPKQYHSEDDEFLNVASKEKIDIDSIRARGFVLHCFVLYY